MSWMSNFAFAHCVRHVSPADLANVDLSSWRTLGCGGEPVQSDTMQQFVERFAPFGLRPQALMTAYGMAENTAGATHSPWVAGIQTDHISQTALRLERQARPAMPEGADTLTVVSCGVPFAGTEISISDDDDAPLPDRCVGEIRIRGASLFSGYYRQPEATARALRGGWFYTGDLGYLADGELYVVGRKKDLIITAGENIHPHHIEEVALTAAGSRARRAAAFGYRDERLGTELPVVVLEVRGRVEEPERNELAARVRQRVQEELGIRLADVRLVRSGWVEVTTSGKVARFANLQKYLDAGWRPAFQDLFVPHLSADQPLEVLEAALVRLVAAVTGRTEIDPHVALPDLGVDSLAMVQLWLLIEENLGRSVPVEQLATRPTIHHLARLLHEGEQADVAAPSPQTQAGAYPIGPRGLRRPAGISAWRWRRNRLLERGPAFKGRALPYAVGTRLLRTVASHPRLRQALYPREIELLHRCLDCVPVQGDPETVLRLSLMTNSWANWRRPALADDAVFARWVTVCGGQVLARLAAEGRGAVLVFHHTPLKKILRRLPTLQGRELTVIGNVGAATLPQSGLPDLAQAVAAGAPLSTTAVRSAQLVRALRTLRGDGLAYVAADDDDGSGGITLPFHGRWRPFRPGAAELALRGEAAFVPVFASMDLGGRITFEFLDPLTPEGGSHEAQVENLLHGYAALLAGRYITGLGAMEWYILRKFLRYPAVAP